MKLDREHEISAALLRPTEAGSARSVGHGILAAFLHSAVIRSRKFCSMRIRNLLFHRATLRLSSLIVLLSLPFPSSALDDPASVEVACPFIAHIVLHDYDGAHVPVSSWRRAGRAAPISTCRPRTARPASMRARPCGYCP